MQLAPNRSPFDIESSTVVNRLFYSPRVLFSSRLGLLVSLLVMTHCPIAFAQSASPAGIQETANNSSESVAVTQPPNDQGAKRSPKFEQQLTEFREFIKGCRDLMIKFHLTTAANETESVTKEFLAAIDKGRGMYSQLIATAVEEYSAAPTKESKLGEFLFGVLTRGCAEDRYEGLVDVGLALNKAGYKGQRLDQYIATAAIAVHQYDLAKPYLDKVFSQPIDPEKNKEAVALYGYYQGLEQIKALWQEELKSQAADSAGEPLPKVKLLTTKGEIVIELFENQAPETVGNFIKLVEDGFYKGILFHRVIEHFMAQTGCPNGDGTGDAGYSIVGEHGKSGARKFFRGTVGMALANGPNTGGSQFYICMLPQPQLNDDYVAFGRVISGIDVLSDLVRVDKSSSEKKEKAATEAPPDEIMSAEVIFKRNHPYVPNIASRTEK